MNPSTDFVQPAASESRYLHGTAPVEQQRLGLLNDLLNERSLRQIALRPGDHVLDVGSGLGQFSRAMARSVRPAGRVIGIERSFEQLTEAHRLACDAGEPNLVEFRQGEATALALRDEEWGSFDVAHTRYLLEHVPDPLAVVRKMVQAVRPGGRVVLADDDHDVLRLWPEPQHFKFVWDAYVHTFRQLGNDPIVGRRLVSLLHLAGALPRSNHWIFFGSCVGSDDFEACVANLKGVLSGAREAIVAGGKIDSNLFGEAMQTLDAWSRLPDAAFWYALSWAEGVRPSVVSHN